MGVIVKQKVKGKGNPWWVFVNYDGKRKSKCIGDRSVAEEIARRIRERIKLGEFRIQTEEMPKFKEYAEKWLEYIKTTKRESTYSRYKNVLNNHIYPIFSEKYLDQITRGQIRDFLISKIGADYSISSVRLIKDVISGIFNYAIDEEILNSNPCSGITRRLSLDKKTKKPEIEPLSKEELSLYLDTCRNYYPEYYPLFLTLARTGMRLGEVLAIYCSDIDFNSKYIWVKRAYRRGRFTLPKNSKTRKVDMSDQLFSVLKSLLTAKKKEALKNGKRFSDLDLLFSKDGKVLEQNYVRRIHERILIKAGLRKIRIHDLRHTYASILLSLGESPAYVKEQLGHHSIQMTVDIYGHLIPSSNRQAVNKLDDVAPYTHPRSNLNDECADEYRRNQKYGAEGGI